MKGNPTNALNRLKYFILQLKDCMMETSCWHLAEGGSTSIGSLITDTRVGVGILTNTRKASDS